MNQLLIVEIKSHLKQGKDDGVIEVFIRSDGNIKRTWTEIVNQTDPGSSFRPIWLRKRPESSNFLTLKIPIIIKKLACGERRGSVDRASVIKYFKMSDEEIYRLTKYFSIPGELEMAQTSERIGGQSRAIKYKELIDGGYFRNQADLARHLGVSRAWITKVMNELKRGRAN
jgi:hypothetical protein